MTPNEVKFPESALGTYNDPIDDFMTALKRAQEIAAPYKDIAITIHLFKGEHFIISTPRLNYHPLDIDEYGQNLDLTIQPYYCEEGSDDTLC